MVHVVSKSSGTGCSKVTTSLVNVYVEILNVNITNTLIIFCWKNVIV